MPLRDGNFSPATKQCYEEYHKNALRPRGGLRWNDCFLVPILIDTGEVAAVIAAFARHMRCCGVLAMARVRIYDGLVVLLWTSEQFLRAGASASSAYRIVQNDLLRVPLSHCSVAL